MPKVKTLTVFERVDPVTRALVQIAAGATIDVTDSEYSDLKKIRAAVLVADESAKPADVSNVVAAAHNVDVKQGLPQPAKRNTRDTGVE